MPNLLAIFPERSPMWKHAVERLTARFGDDIGFAYDLNRGEDRIAEAQIVLSFALTEDAAAMASGMRWVQALGSGVEGIRLPHDRDIVLTSAHGLHAAPVSEAAIAGMLAYVRDVPGAVRDQTERRWAPRAATLLRRSTLGILGTGDIAQALARKARAFEMQVIGFSNSPRVLENFNLVLPRTALFDTIRDVDYLALLAPLDADTHHIIDEALLARLKRGALLINVGRGALVDEAALIDALASGRIAAVLDTFAQEPLPSDSPLWALPNVLITPHSAGRHRGYVDDVIDLFLLNYDRFVAGDIAGMRNRLAPSPG